MAKLQDANLDAHEFADCNPRRNPAQPGGAAVCASRPVTSKRLEKYNQALAIRRQLVAEKGAADLDERNLARTYGYLGDLRLARGEYREADEAYWASHRLREASVKRNPRLRAAIPTGPQLVELRQLSMRQFASDGTALWFHEQRLKILQDIHKKQPDNKDYSGDLGDVLNRIVELELLTAGEKPDTRRLERASELLVRARNF